MNDDLLPLNATPAEKAIAGVIRRTSEPPVRVKQLWDPEHCPEELLPWLAWSLSIDNWDSAWPTAIKRQLIAQSIEIHRRKGTVEAVKRAMAVLGVQVELREWFEYQGTPHTFSVMAWVGDNFREDDEPLLTDQYYRALKQAIDYSKPVRSHYDFKVGVLFGAGLGMALISQTTAINRIQGESLFPGVQLHSILQVGGFQRTHAVTRISMEIV